MNALAELQKRARTPANPANPANQGRQRVADSQDSQDSQGVEVEKHFLTPAVSAPLAPLADSLKPLRAHLLTLAERLAVDVAHVHRLHDLDIAACIGLDVRQLAAYLSTLAATADRHAGRVPLDDTAAMHCEQCARSGYTPTLRRCYPWSTAGRVGWAALGVSCARQVATFRARL